MTSTKLPQTKKRIKKLLLLVGILLAAGVSYAVFCSLTDWYIPCIFRLITGFQCPGCGVSHMCVALLHLDFKGAWEANPAILLLTPFLLYLAVVSAVRYVKTGHVKLHPAEEILTIIACVGLLIFGVVRNLPL